MISSKHPNHFLYDNLVELYIIYKDTKIIIIDSDSDTFDTYTKIKESFPDIEINFSKNKNYVYGAWKIGYTLYPDYDAYMCIHDSMTVKNKINLEIIDSKHVYTFYNKSGFYLDYQCRDIAIQLMDNTGLHYHDLLYLDFNLATHCSFIIANARLNHMYSVLINPPVNKLECRAYERIFGIYFIIHDIHMIDISDSIIKNIGWRK